MSGHGAGTSGVAGEVRVRRLSPRTSFQQWRPAPPYPAPVLVPVLIFLIGVGVGIMVAGVILGSREQMRQRAIAKAIRRKPRNPSVIYDIEAEDRRGSFQLWEKEWPLEQELPEERSPWPPPER